MPVLAGTPTHSKMRGYLVGATLVLERAAILERIGAGVPLLLSDMHAYVSMHDDGLPIQAC